MADSPGSAPSSPPLPYKIAVLCDLRDGQGRILLIRRKKHPNFGLCSPIGGKLDMTTGESPAQCARREIMEEAGIELPIERLRLAGMISETAFEGNGHWLIFWYRVLGPVRVETREIREGWLEWHDPASIDALPLPNTDRRIIWPLVNQHDGRFFAVHIDCGADPDDLKWVVEQAG